MVITCNPNTKEAGVGESEFKASLGYLVRLCLQIDNMPLQQLKNKQQTNNNNKDKKQSVSNYSEEIQEPPFLW